MKKSWAVVGLVCTVGAALVASAAALQSDDGWFRQRATGVFVRRIERQLNITDAQREQIRVILKGEQPTILALATRIRQEQEQLNSRQSFDEAWVRAFAQQHATTTEDVFVERQKVRFEIMQVLTSDQQKRAEQLQKTLSIRLSDRLATIGDEL